MRTYRIILMAIIACFINITTPANAETVTNCDFESLKSIILRLNQTDGGEVDFACAGKIRFTETLTISGDVTLNGTEDVILDGYGLYTLFKIENNASLTLDTVTIQEAWQAIENRGILTITNSLFHDNQAYIMGSVIHNFGDVSISDSTFTGNETSEGGVIYNRAGNMTITNSTFSMNRAYTKGGAIFNDADMTITGCIFNQNSVEGAYTTGGAIWNEGNMTIADSQFAQNSAYSAGAIYNTQQLTIANSQFTHHTGGAIYTSHKLFVRDSTFADNDGGYGGAISSSGEVVIWDTDFLRNTGSVGGAIENDQAMTIRGSLFEANIAERGGGAIFNYWKSGDDSVEVSISHSTFKDNVAGLYGGAIYYDNTDTIAIFNNTFVNNSAKVGGAFYNGAEGVANIIYNTFVNNLGLGGALYNNNQASIQYNLISGDGSQCSGLQVGLVDETNLTDSRCGGAGRVDSLMLGEFDGRVFPLLDESPAINIAPLPCDVSRDQLGIPRPLGEMCDAGATEWVSADDVIITTPQNITITDCTAQVFQEAITILNWVGGEITLDCPADTIIPITKAFTINTDMTLTSLQNVILDAGGESIFFKVEFGASFTLDNFTLQNGDGEHGGAIYNGGNLTIRNSIFTDNRAKHGGAIYNNGSLIITDSQLNNNRAMLGGAIYSKQDMTISHTTLKENQTFQGEGDMSKPLGDGARQYYNEEEFDQAGGAIYTDGRTIIRQSVFDTNIGSQAGGAIFNTKFGRLTVEDSQFKGNSADKGGALYYAADYENAPMGNSGPISQFVVASQIKSNHYSKPMRQIDPYPTPILVLNSTFEENSANQGGAIFNALWSTPVIQASLFTQNEASADGGAIFSGADILVIQSTFIENHADKGGALYGGYSANNTFIRNHADTQGGAVYYGGIYHSTFVDNTAPEGGAVYSSNLTATIIVGVVPQCDGQYLQTKNIIANIQCGDASVIEDVGLGEFDGWVVPLLPNSPAIDVIPESCDNFYTYNFLVEIKDDQLGTPRPQGEKCDLGAVEFVPDTP